MIKITENQPFVLLALYGVLMDKGMLNHYYLKNKSECLGEFWTEPEYTMFNVGHRPALLNKGKTSIYTHIYKIPQQAVLDKVLRVEGALDSRESEIKEIITPFGKAFLILNTSLIEPHHPQIQSGHWLRKPLERKDYIHKQKQEV